jgi:hypothetical protein
MSDLELCLKNCRAAQMYGHEINDATARTIAGLYYRGQFTLGYQFLSTGYIGPNLWRDIFPDYEERNADDRLIADMFGTYLINSAGNRDLDNWSDLWVDKQHQFRTLHFTGAGYCETCDSPYCDNL